MSTAALSAALTHCVESKLHARISRAFTFKLIQVNRDIIQSKSYLIISRRNSCTVYVNDLGFVEVKLYIKVFVHVSILVIMELLTAAYNQLLISDYLQTISPKGNQAILFLLRERIAVR